MLKFRLPVPKLANIMSNKLDELNEKSLTLRRSERISNQVAANLLKRKSASACKTPTKRTKREGNAVAPPVDSGVVLQIETVNRSLVTNSTVVSSDDPNEISQSNVDKTSNDTAQLQEQSSITTNKLGEYMRKQCIQQKTSTHKKKPKNGKSKTNIYCKRAIQKRKYSTEKQLEKEVKGKERDLFDVAEEKIQLPPLITTKHYFDNSCIPSTYDPNDCDHPIPSLLPSYYCNRKQREKLEARPSLLPSQYPLHFVHQKKPEEITSLTLKKYFELQNNSQLATSEKSQKYDLETSSTSTPSLPESLVGIFDSDNIRDILHVEKTVYRLSELHMQALAIVLNLETNYLKRILYKIQKLSSDVLDKFVSALDKSLQAQTMKFPEEQVQANVVINSNLISPNHSPLVTEYSPSPEHRRYFSK